MEKRGLSSKSSSKAGGQKPGSGLGTSIQLSGDLGLWQCLSEAGVRAGLRSGLCPHTLTLNSLLTPPSSSSSALPHSETLVPPCYFGHYLGFSNPGAARAVEGALRVRSASCRRAGPLASQTNPIKTAAAPASLGGLCIPRLQFLQQLCGWLSLFLSYRWGPKALVT